MTRIARLILHGISPDAIDIELDSSSSLSDSLETLDNMISNTSTYFSKSLGMKPQNLFIFAGGEFRPVLGFKTPGRVLDSESPLPMIIFWADFDIAANPSAQKELLRFYGLEAEGGSHSKEDTFWDLEDASEEKYSQRLRFVTPIALKGVVRKLEWESEPKTSLAFE